MRIHGLRADRSHGYEDLERIAALVRARLGWGPEERIPSVSLFEKLDEITVTLSDGKKVGVTYHVTADLPNEAQSAYDPGRNVIVVTLHEDTYAGLEDERSRDRFSVYHELGHVVLHPDLLVRLSAIHHTQAAMMRGAKPKHPVYFDTEFHANGFAAALLMPAPGLAAIEAMTKVQNETAYVQNWYGVSAESAGYRWATYRARRQELLRAAKEGLLRGT